MNMVIVKESIGKAKSIRAAKFKNETIVKELRVKWKAVETVSVEKRAKIEGQDASFIEFGLSSGNYVQCWIVTEEVPKIFKKWEQVIALRG